MLFSRRARPGVAALVVSPQYTKRMKKFIPLAFTLCITIAALLGLCACSQAGKPISGSYDVTKFVRVAVIKPAIAEHVAKVFTDAGIPGMIDKSAGTAGTRPAGFYSVTVPPSFQSQATTLLRKEAAKEGYSDQIQF